MKTIFFYLLLTMQCPFCAVRNSVDPKRLAEFKEVFEGKDG